MRRLSLRVSRRRKSPLPAPGLASRPIFAVRRGKGGEEALFRRDSVAGPSRSNGLSGQNEDVGASFHQENHSFLTFAVLFLRPLSAGKTSLARSIQRERGLGGEK